MRYECLLIWFIDIDIFSLLFTISLTNELRERLADNMEALQYMSVFNVEETLKHNKSLGEIEKIAKLLGYSPAAIDKIVQQWRAIHLSKWNETKNTVGFWSEIWKFRRFLLTFCLSHDVIPLSYSVHYNYAN